MKVLVLGAGMYVSGRKNTGPGVILAALTQLSRTLPLEHVLVVARSAENILHINAAVSRLNALLNTTLHVSYIAIPGADLETEVSELCTLNRFDCAVLSTPDHLHYAPLRALLTCKVPTLVVKPLVPTLAEGLALLELQQITGTYCAVEFHKRHDESNLFAKKILSEGQLGRLLYMSVDYSQRIQIPRDVFRGWADRSNIFQYLAVHYVDLIHFLTGFIPLRLTAYGTRGVLANEGIDTFDSIHTMIEWQDAAGQHPPFLSHHNANWIDPDCTRAMSDQRFKIVGALGRIECDQRDRGIELVRESTGNALVNPYFAEFLPTQDGSMEFQGYGFRSISLFIQDVIAIAQGQTSPCKLESIRPSLRQALVSTAVIDTVNQALRAPPAWREINGLP